MFRISASGEVTQFAHFDADTFPNDLAFHAAGNIFLTEPFLGKVWKITPQGAVGVWSYSPLLAGDPTHPALLVHWFWADGIAFDRGDKILYVGNLDAGTIVRIPVNADGSAGTPSVWVADARLKGCDGIAFDAAGNLYVAVNGQDQLLKVSTTRVITVVAKGTPLDAPSSLVFGRRNCDKNDLYIASFAINRVLQTQPGTPQPNLLRLPLAVPGLPIP